MRTQSDLIRTQKDSIQYETNKTINISKTVKNETWNRRQHFTSNVGTNTWLYQWPDTGTGSGTGSWGEGVIVTRKCYSMGKSSGMVENKFPFPYPLLSCRERSCDSETKIGANVTWSTRKLAGIFERTRSVTPGYWVSTRVRSVLNLYSERPTFLNWTDFQNSDGERRRERHALHTMEAHILSSRFNEDNTICCMSGRRRDNRSPPTAAFGMILPRQRWSSYLYDGT